MRLYTFVILSFVLLFLASEIAASSSYHKKCKTKKHKKRKDRRSCRIRRSIRRHRGSGKRPKTVVTVRRRAPTVVRIRGDTPLPTVRDSRVGQKARNQRRPTVIRVGSVGTTRLAGGTLGRVLNNGRVMDMYAPKQLIRDAVGTTWINVEFGNIDTPVNKLFLVESDVNIVVRVVDLFCTGDIFDVYAIAKDKKTLLGTTSSVQSDNCETTTADADHAWSHGQWSRGEFILNPGRYKIMIVPHSSPYGGGSAAVRFDEEADDPLGEVLDGSEWETGDEASTDDSASASSSSDSSYYSSDDTDDSGSDESEVSTKRTAKSICKGTSGFTVVKGAYRAKDMEDACEGYGQAAVLTASTAHKRSVLKTLQACVKPDTSLWIASYTGASSKYYYAVTREGQNTVNVADFPARSEFGVLCLN